MKRKAVLGLSILVLAGTMFAAEGPVPTGVRHLDHVFVIMMENHGFSQIVGNPNAPFANQFMKSANAAKKYFAVGHPSLTNYLEVVGASNFGIRSDNPPDWHNATCQPNLATAMANLDGPVSSGKVCPIAGTGTDAETPAIDSSDECSATAPCNDINGVLSVPAAANTVAKTIADQLAERGHHWKSYEEGLPPTGADNVNFSDGFFTNNDNIPSILSGEKQTLIQLYAAKHDPFVYFKSIQEGDSANSSLRNVVGFEGKSGLFEDLESGHVPAFSFIAPNQCNDQHGRGNAGPQCDFDPSDTGAQSGLNPALIFVGDQALRNIVHAIHSSPVWKEGRNAIVVLWDESDFSSVPNVNQVLTIVDLSDGPHGRSSKRMYTHFSLTKTLDAAFGLPCLNHACDSDVNVMSDLFGANDNDGDDQ
jgi:hypothetical protein